MLLIALIACTAKDTDDEDTGDTAVTDTFPCDADYFPVDFNTRRYTYTEYKGRFEQPLSTGARSLEFLGLLEEGDTAEPDPEAITGCVFNLVVPMGLGQHITIYGLGEEWIYLLGDGDRDNEGNEIYYFYKEPIPLIPLAPQAGWQDTIDVEYVHPDYDSEIDTVVGARVAEVSEPVTVPAGSYDALKMAWTWEMLDGQERQQIDLDITAYFDVDEGLVRQSWYDSAAETSAIIEFDGY